MSAVWSFFRLCITTFQRCSFYRLFSFARIITEVGLLRRCHVEIHHPVFSIVLTGNLVPLLIVEVRNHRNDDITQIPVAARERSRLLSSRLRERGGLGLVALAEADCENLVGSIHAVLHILRVVQVLQNTLAEGDAVLVDKNVRGSNRC